MASCSHVTYCQKCYIDVNIRGSGPYFYKDLLVTLQGLRVQQRLGVSLRLGDGVHWRRRAQTRSSGVACSKIQLNASAAVCFSSAPVGTRPSLSLCLTPSQNGKQGCSAQDIMALDLLQPPVCLFSSLFLWSSHCHLL